MAEENKAQDKVYKLIFRYRHQKKTLNFYAPPKKFSEEHEYWDQLLEATRFALKQAFGEVAHYIVGIAQYVHGPVVPLSVIVTQPKRYMGSYLDLIIDDESPFLVDIQTKRASQSRKEYFKNVDRLLKALDAVELGLWYEVLTKEHKEKPHTNIISKVDYETFLLLDKSDLKEMQIPIGIRKKFLLLIQKEKQNSEESKKIARKTKWEDSQRQLSVPKYFPLRSVEPIPYSRLLDVKFRESFGDFLRMHLHYYGWSFIKLPPPMVEKVNEYKSIWNKFFDSDQSIKDACVIHKTPSGAYGGYYDEADRQMFQVVPLMLGCNPPWPDGDSVFQEKAVEMFFFLEKITKMCLSALAHSLGIDPELFIGVCEEEYTPRMLGTSVRVCKYKKQEENTGVICVPHTDTTLLSLGAVSSVPELQFYDRSRGEWVYAESEVDDTHVILFVGRMLARMTGGYFQPSYHRVYRRYVDERLSLPFFLRPRVDAILENEKIIKSSNIPNWQLPGGIAPREILITDGGKYDFKPYQ